MPEAIAFTDVPGLRRPRIGESGWPRASRIDAVAGGAERHDLTAHALWERLMGGARAQRCRAFVGNGLLNTPSAAAYYPDVLVTCGNAADHDETSPSTETTDRREKAESHARIQSRQTYVLAHPTFRRLEIAERGLGRSWHWHADPTGDVWITPYGDIHVDDLDDAIEAEATT